MSQKFTDKEKLDIAMKALKSVNRISITDGCEECSSIWQRDYELKLVTEAIEKIEKGSK